MSSEHKWGVWRERWSKVPSHFAGFLPRPSGCFPSSLLGKLEPSSLLSQAEKGRGGTLDQQISSAHSKHQACQSSVLYHPPAHKWGWKKESEISSAALPSVLFQLLFFQGRQPKTCISSFFPKAVEEGHCYSEILPELENSSLKELAKKGQVQFLTMPPPTGWHLALPWGEFSLFSSKALGH